MSGFNEYSSYDAVGLAALIRDGEVTAEEALAAALARMRQVQPQLNAVVHEMEDEARRTLAAGVPDGPFAGVPFMLKDLNLFYAGQPTHQGSRYYEGNVADHDSELVARHKAAGLVVIAKTNTPEFGLCATTEPRPKTYSHERRVHFYVERGRYSEQIRRLWHFYDKSQLLILRSEDLNENPEVVLREVCGFLRISASPYCQIGPIRLRTGNSGRF